MNMQNNKGSYCYCILRQCYIIMMLFLIEESKKDLAYEYINLSTFKSRLLHLIGCCILILPVVYFIFKQMIAARTVQLRMQHLQFMKLFSNVSPGRLTS